ncbi:MAG: hypothetical protein U9P70_00875 [Patescibacteria group bacterium]|nr:hypothetical protein [Patescibacteria group bacterium]
MFGYCLPMFVALLLYLYRLKPKFQILQTGSTALKGLWSQRVNDNLTIEQFNNLFKC